MDAELADDKPHQMQAHTRGFGLLNARYQISGTIYVMAAMPCHMCQSFHAIDDL